MAAYLLQRSILSARPLSIEMQVLLGYKYVDPPNGSAPIPVVAPMAFMEGVGETSTDASYTDA